MGLLFGNWKCPRLDYGADCTALNLLRNVELHAFNGWIVWCELYLHSFVWGKKWWPWIEICHSLQSGSVAEQGLKEWGNLNQQFGRHFMYVCIYFAFLSLIYTHNGKNNRILTLRDILPTSCLWPPRYISPTALFFIYVIHMCIYSYICVYIHINLSKQDCVRKSLG